MKRISTLLLAAMLLMVFTACGGASSAPAAPSSGAPQTSASTPSADEPILVGILAPLTGPVSQYGIAVRDGAKLYLDQVNQAGGINGKQIKIVE